MPVSPALHSAHEPTSGRSTPYESGHLIRAPSLSRFIDGSVSSRVDPWDLLLRHLFIAAKRLVGLIAASRRCPRLPASR